MWSILEVVGGGKMPYRINVLIENNYFHDQQHSGPIVLGDYVESDQFEVKKTCFLCMLDSRDRAQHYTKKDWHLREELVPCK